MFNGSNALICICIDNTTEAQLQEAAALVLPEAVTVLGPGHLLRIPIVEHGIPLLHTGIPIDIRGVPPAKHR